MLNRLFRQRPAYAAGEALYALAAAKARDPAFYRDAGAPDTVEGRFELYMIHVILLVLRLRGQGRQAQETSQVMFDAFLRGLDDAMREMGVGDLSVGKKMRKLGEAFYGRAKGYAESLGDPAAREALVRRTLFADAPGEGADAGARTLADYLARARAPSRRPAAGTPARRRGELSGPRAMTAAPPWSVPVRLSEIQRGPRTLELAADAAARARIATLLDLPALERFEARVNVAPWLDGAQVDARWSADLSQTCSVTAEPFAGAFSGEFSVRAVPADSRAAPSPEAEVSVDPDAEDPPDVLEGEVVDLGAYLVEHLALELDPFPRAPGAQFEPPAAEPEPSPFAALAALKRS